MKTLAVVVVGIAFLAVAEAAKCDDHKFQQCMGTFAKDLGMAKIPADLTEFVLALAQLVGKEGYEGQKKICTAMKNLKTCLGDQYDSCISVDYLKSIGQPEPSAAGFVGLAAQYGYMCTTGWDIITKQWDCMAKVGKDNLEYIQKCVTDYQANLRKDPGNACKYTQQYTDCYDDPFNKTCGAELAGVLCQSAKVSYAPVLPGCVIICYSGLEPPTATPTKTPTTTPHSGGIAHIKKSAIGGIISILVLMVKQRIGY